MGLYMNTQDHPAVFKNNGELKEPNQAYYRYDAFSELLQEQKSINKSLTLAYRDLQTLYQQQEHKQANEWQAINQRIELLQKQQEQQEHVEKQLMEGLALLEENQKTLETNMSQELAEVKQDVAEDMENISVSQGTIESQLYEIGNYQQHVQDQLAELVKLQEKMAEKVSTQDEKQNDVLNRMDNQEALLQKTVRQIDHIRSILYERASFLVEKMESIFKISS
ncbi:hypothetical protein [Oceanobacillus halotolerans]|uniref:hypothetical protein n=1 Tax=Oceanobacillus halotolerans TaxID=2663380 RepID=UPI0013D04741|nr:hypothetical protein [Oceanobacillus halotolerans]